MELTPLLAERGRQIWGPLGEEATSEIGRLSRDQLELVKEFFRLGRDVNRRHIERVRALNFD